MRAKRTMEAVAPRSAVFRCGGWLGVDGGLRRRRRRKEDGFHQNLLNEYRQHSCCSFGVSLFPFLLFLCVLCVCCVCVVCVCVCCVCVCVCVLCACVCVCVTDW